LNDIILAQQATDCGTINMLNEGVGAYPAALNEPKAQVFHGHGFARICQKLMGATTGTDARNTGSRKSRKSLKPYSHL
jgi:hypothetical protein